MKNIFRDLLIKFLPRKLCKILFNYDYNFAFLIHTRYELDFYKQFKFAQKVPKFIVNAICYLLWPFIISEITGVKDETTSKEIKGIMIVVPLTTKQMLRNKTLAVKRIIQAAKLVEKLGVKYLGLGALSASLTKGGLDLVEKVNLILTTGHALTVFIITNYFYSVINKFALNLGVVTIAIIGAAGSIGSNSAKLIISKSLSQGGLKKIILIDLKRKMDRVRNLAQELQKMDKNLIVIYSTNKQYIKNADIIVTATSAPEVIIKPEDLKEGMIIIDDAQPTDVDEQVILTRKDVLVLTGGAVHIKGVDCHLDIGLQNKGDVFSCLAEVIALSIMHYDKKFFAIGRLNYNLIKKMERVFYLLKFSLAEYQNMYKKYTDNDLNYIKTIIKKRK